MKRVIVSDEVHRALRGMAGMRNQTVGEYIEFLVAIRVPSALIESRKQIRYERRKKQNGKRKKT